MVFLSYANIHAILMLEYQLLIVYGADLMVCAVVIMARSCRAYHDHRTFQASDPLTSECAPLPSRPDHEVQEMTCNEVGAASR